MRGVGVTLSLYGAGMVLGALAAPRLMARVPFGAAIAIGPLVSVAASLAMAASLAWPTPALAALSFFLFGAGPIVWTVSSTTLRRYADAGGDARRACRRSSSPRMPARGPSARRSAPRWLRWRAGPAITACLLLAAAGFAVQAAVIVTSPVRGLRSLVAVARRGLKRRLNAESRSILKNRSR
ncbi:MAG: hypothetical protein U1F67_24050 [Rubrivivax sp.]